MEDLFTLLRQTMQVACVVECLTQEVLSSENETQAGRPEAATKQQVLKTIHDYKTTSANKMEAIYREIKEETSLEIDIGKVVYIYTNRDQIPVRQTFQAVYLCKHKSGKIHLNPLEHDMHKWVSYDDIANFDTIDFLRELVKTYHPAIL
jgi:8-oxo-dGTP pyrophosphatase MutT (NUDIX family)